MLGMVSQASSFTPLKLAWRVSCDGEIGRMALARLIPQVGQEAALAEAARWFERRPSPEIAALAGLLAEDLGRGDEAGRFLSLGRELGDDRQGMLEHLELAITARDPDPEKKRRVIERLQARRDLSPWVKKHVLDLLLLEAMLSGRLSEAADRANHLLAVEENLAASVTLWALAKKDGDARAVARHATVAAGQPEADRLYLQCMANAAIGDRAEALGDLARLRELNPDLARMAARYIDEEEATAWTS